MSFSRQAAEGWSESVPGARWFKADLHIHTIDDHPGGKAKWPPGLAGDPRKPADLKRYARAFLQGVIRAGIHVLGLTPHSPRAGEGPETSAVWHIVETWNEEDDDDGTPFREKIFAVFPGFEPSFNEGKQGLHLIVLFDPEIGRERYLKLFEVLMGGIAPWQEGTLTVSNLTASGGFKALNDFLARECPLAVDGSKPWGNLVLAPHVDAPTGLFGAKKAQVLALFEHHEVAALELPDGKLAAEFIAEKPEWFKGGLERYRHALFHGSDAYRVPTADAPEASAIGHRYTWLKLASPRIEALRQALLAPDSRLRMACERGEDGALRELAHSPDAAATSRPWLRRVTVSGGASFFGGQKKSKPRQTVFELSPDLTCILGGSMTGKSTFLDGLRCHLEADPPRDRDLAATVEARGRERFLAGSPEIELDLRGGDPVEAAGERWPALFFAQGELQRLASEPDAVEDILARLVPGLASAIESRREEMAALNAALLRDADELDRLEEQVGEAEQEKQRAEEAERRLEALEEAGFEALQAAERQASRLDSDQKAAEAFAGQVENLLDAAEELAPGLSEEELASLWEEGGEEGPAPPLAARAERLLRATATLKDEARAYQRDLARYARLAEALGSLRRQGVEQALAAGGHDAGALKEFRVLADRARRVESYRAADRDLKRKRDQVKQRFTEQRKARGGALTDLRRHFDQVLEQIERDFDGRIRARRLEGREVGELEQLLVAFKQKGISRWWNGLPAERRPTPYRLLEALAKGNLTDLGMSEVVAETFGELMTRSMRLRLAALPAGDRYELELRLEDGSYRPLSELSGGQRVSVLLSLLLETHDERPLLIDQPEDELDNRFLFGTVLPALRRIKGRRQVIVATHNANIVVNGDADQVIVLEATAHAGRVAVAGAIEDPRVRDAIVNTVDGGGEAFRLRQLKYGF